MFKSISINRQWRQFDYVDILFNKATTIITGSNGSGKTSILNLLALHYGWNSNFVSTPFFGKRKGQKIWSDFVSKFYDGNDLDENEKVYFGKIEYFNSDNICNIWIKNNSSNQYTPNFENRANVSGIHIPSHRPNNSYQPVENIPTNPKTRQQHYNDYQQILLQTYSSTPRQNPGIIQKQSLISLGLFGYGNQVVHENVDYIEAFEGFQEILSKILPKEIGFQRIEIRMPEVVLITSSGDFALEAMSGGINALFGMAWQIYMFGQDRSDVVVTIDEPENHLHPSMQRSLVPALERAFPNYQLIIATHSPFIVTSSRSASVYGLYHDENNRVRSTKLTDRELAASPNRILRDILNVPSTIPIWAEDQIVNIIRESKNMEIDARADFLWTRLEEIGLTDAIADIGDIDEID